MNTDPRGPIRTAVAVDSKPDAHYVTLDCGHVAHWNAANSAHVGDTGHCLACKDESNG